MRRFAGCLIGVLIGMSVAATAITVETAVTSPVAAAQDDPAVWQRLWHPAFRATLGSRIGMENVQRVGDRFAIVGGDERGAVVWWSDDGLEWTRTPRTPRTDHGVGAAIAAGPDGYVMVGQQWTPTPRGRIWHSTDGREWRAASTKLPPDSNVWSVIPMDGGTFAAYGDGGRRGDCWMGSSPDGGSTWDFRWGRDWDPGHQGGCVDSAAQDGAGLVGIIAGTISESADGVTWREVVPAAALEEARPKGTKRYIDVGLVPLDDGRFVLGGKGKRTLTWSREAGLDLVEDLIDWNGMKRVAMVIGPEHVIAVKNGMPAPLLSPAADVYTEQWQRREPVCRPRRPKIGHLIAMRPQERLDCYGGRELAIEAWVPFSEYGGTCPFGDPYRWISCENYWLASGPGVSPGFLNFGFAPDAREGSGGWGDHIRVIGHFDDPAAALCPEPGWNGKLPNGWERRTRADFVNECRQQFIVTEVRRIRE